MLDSDKTKEQLIAELEAARRLLAPAETDAVGRKKTEEALRESQATLSSIIDNTSDWIWAVDASRFGLILFNKGLQDYFARHLALDICSGMPPEAMLPPGRAGKWSALYRRALEEGSFQTEYQTVAGSITLLLSFDRVLRDGKVASIVVFGKDITERKRVEEALRESEDRFRTLANAIPQLCWMANAEGWIFWYNERWYEYTGTTPEEMEGWGWQSVHDPVALPRVLERWKASIATRKPFDMVFPLRGRDGVFRPFLTRGMPVRDQEGNVVRWCGTNTDISERRQMEESLHRKVKERTSALELKNQELRDFAFIASHDLQEPLRKIQTFGDRLRMESEGCLNEAGLDSLARMEKAAGRMQDLIDSLLTYSSLAARQEPFQTVDLNLVVREALENLAPRLAETRGQIEVDVLPTIEADARRMRQLFENLFSNALKFHRPGVPPVVRVRGRCRDEAQTVCEISVSDNGIGFDDRFLAKIFRPFQRLHGKERFQGTGIGLAIVRNIVERHNGTIAARGVPGQGAAFTVVLPMRHGQAPAVSSPFLQTTRQKTE